MLEGRLEAGHQRVIGSTPRIRRELEDAGLWIDDGPRVLINDWESHNGARDKKERERRIRDAERKRLSRGQSSGRPADSPADTTSDVHADGAPVKIEEVKSDSKEQDQALCSNEQRKALALVATTRLRSVQ